MPRRKARRLVWGKLLGARKPDVARWAEHPGRQLRQARLTSDERPVMPTGFTEQALRCRRNAAEGYLPLVEPSHAPKACDIGRARVCETCLC